MITFKYFSNFPNSIKIINDAPLGIIAMEELCIPNEINGQTVNPYIEDICVEGSPLKVKTLTIAEGFSSFSEVAFQNISFKKLILPSSLTRLPLRAFKNHKHLEEVFFPKDCRLSTIPYECFVSCSNLTTVSLGENVTTIEEHAFSACSSLKRFNFEPKEEITIQAHAFQGALKLYNMDMSKWNLKTISAYCFAHSELKEVKFPDVLEKIESSAFYDTSLSHCFFPKNLQKIEQSAFSNTSLSAITVPLKAATCEVDSYAFQNAAFLNLKIPNNFKFIGKAHFAHNSVLISVDFSDNKNMDTITTSMFQDCKNLKNVKFNNISKIKAFAFTNCNISKLELPISVEEIEQEAFSYNSLSEVDFSNTNINYIGDKAFMGNGIETVNLNYFITKIHLTAFDENFVNFEEVISQSPFAEIVE